MRRFLFALGTLALGACIPLEHDWQVVDATFRGLLVEVVEPGGYGSLLNVPPDRRRAFVLPLDTVELEWKVAVPPGQELQPPIWIACDHATCLGLWTPVYFGPLPDCPDPMPLGVHTSCRLGEGHRIRVRMAGAYSSESPSGFMLLVVGSRRPDLPPAECLERLSADPRPDLGPCLVILRDPPTRATPFGLPFVPEDAGVPPEVLAEEADTNPTVLGFTVTRERGDVREELVVDVGATVPVRRGDRLHVEPRLAADAAQQYWVSEGDLPNMPWSGTLVQQTEHLIHTVRFSEPVLYDHLDGLPTPHFAIPHDVVPTTLWLDIFDDRNGKAFVDLEFVPEDDA
ncbi:hypothetical protein SAMN02745121_03258 [Nannocystis exedens]|uniref:Lipoprotein n=1 Tax=Nannocystis exedens TaxID=54 RepID=A0A1I1Y9E9_9BACT|nr:hypothetical protein [Nannocystis exedens]PCC71908.1 hypothetical protein NAEX_04987 [Nannocystis exedens]SFE16196.1 hypothetical protein SAMN02745121_03258 [Nannocystis exedens]